MLEIKAEHKKLIAILIGAVAAVILIVVGIVYASSYGQKTDQGQPVTDQAAATTSAEVSQNTGVRLVPQSTRQLSNQEFIDLINRSATTTAGIMVKRP